MSKKIIVAIDGYSSCGKSTMAKALAQSVGYIYVDTGAMYRGVTLACLRAGILSEGGVGIKEEDVQRVLDESELSFCLDAKGLPELYLNGERVEDEIREMKVAEYVSYIAAMPVVRIAMTEQQKRIGQEKGVVMDGRDIGTAVFPEAEMKVFVKADPHIRAERRLLELRERGDKETTLEEVLRNVEARDERDIKRTIAPLKQADDAFVLDNSYLTLEEQSEVLLTLFREKTQTTC